MSDRISTEYRACLERAEGLLGPLQLGDYAKFRGRLVKKLSFAEFRRAWTEYRRVRQAHDRALDQGDTVNNVVAQLLEERAAELLLPI